MGLKVITPPTVEPVSVEEIKDHLRIINDEEYSYLEGLIQAAREYCEAHSNRSYVQQTLVKTFDEWPEFPVELPRPPLMSVEKIEYKDSEGTLTEWSASNYAVDEYSFMPKVYLADDYSMPNDTLYPTNAIQITYKAGYEPDDSGDTTDYTANVPARFKHAIKLLCGEWYSNREEIVNTGAVPQSIPDGVKSLLGVDRVIPI